ncbi:MAG: phage portal protein [Clostridia bacterium]|nr:phage portal protein [Clostridia bacterium]
MKLLNLDIAAPGVRTDFGGRVTDLRFLELEIAAWLKGKTRRQQRTAERYYEGKQDILRAKRELIDENGNPQELKFLPNNHIIDNQYAKMVDQITNFEMGQPITFDTNMKDENGKKYAQALAKVFDKRTHRTLQRVTKHAVNEGISWLYVWKDADELRLSLFPASEILPFWSDADHTELDCAVHFYDVIEYDDHEKKKTVHHAEVLDAAGVHRFIWTKGGRLIPDVDTPAMPYLTVTDDSSADALPYNWERMPLIPFKANDKEQPLLLKCKQLQDALNTIMTIFMNRTEEDAYNTVIILKNYDGENVGKFRRNMLASGVVKVRTVDGADGGIDTLAIDVNPENFELIAKLLKKAIIENCGGFDVKDERMNGNPNQMNIQSMYADIEITANGLETEFSASFEELLWFVAMHLKQTNVGDFENEKADVIFNRDMMVNESEVIDNCQKSGGLISNETILKNHPWIDDPQAEMERLETEQNEAAQQNDAYRGAFEQQSPAGGVTGDGGEE